MILIFGGAYNGKLEYVKEQYNLNNNEIFYCQGNKLDFSKKVISGIHVFTYENAANEISALEYIKENIELLRDKIIICDDISSGIVPIKKEERVWREETGKCLQYLAKEAHKVIRVYCGIPVIIKGNK